MNEKRTPAVLIRRSQPLLGTKTGSRTSEIEFLEDVIWVVESDV